MKITVTNAQVREFKKILSTNPRAKEAFRDWIDQNPEKVADLKIELSGAPRDTYEVRPEDFIDALTEDEMSYVSRPYGLEKLHSQGVTGAGVTVAVIDSGIAPHPDFEDRIVAFRDFTGKRVTKKNPIDRTGHGTHVSGIIAGDGEVAQGIAPDAQLVGCRVNSEKGAVKAIDWVIANREKYSIDVLNLSLGVDAPINPSEDEFRKAAERAVKAGLVVVAAAGNESRGGHTSTISSPGISPDVITVGALDDRGTSDRTDDGVYSTSSRGQKNGGKPDLVAEGVNVLAPLADDSSFAENLGPNADYLALAGSSQAAPMVSGAIALMLQVNPDLGHKQIKTILKQTADKLEDVPRNAQGSGRLDLVGAIRSAKKAQAKAAS